MMSRRGRAAVSDAYKVQHHNHTVPHGTIMSPCTRGISCLATFTWSLRDKGPRSSKRNSDTGGHALGIVVRTGQFAVVVDVGRNTIAPDHGHASPNQQTVPTDPWAIHGKIVPGSVGKVGNDRIGAVTVFVLPGSAYLRPDQRASNLPIVRHFDP